MNPIGRDTRTARMASILFLLLAAVLTAGCAASPAPGPEAPVLRLVKDMSTFHDFSVTGNRVYIRCELTIHNTSSSDVSFYVKGDFPEDKKGGLLKDSALYAYHSGTDDKLFEIGANETLELVVVDFIGDFGGTEQKQNRLLPNMEFEIQDTK